MVDKTLDINNETYLSSTAIATYLDQIFQERRKQGETRARAIIEDIADAINYAVSREVIVFDKSTPNKPELKTNTPRDEPFLKELCKIKNERFPDYVDYATLSYVPPERQGKWALHEYQQSQEGKYKEMKAFVEKNLNWCIHCEYPYLNEWGRLVSKKDESNG